MNWPKSLVLCFNYLDTTNSIVRVLSVLHEKGIKHPVIFLPIKQYNILGQHPTNPAYEDYALNCPYDGYSINGVKLIATDSPHVVTNGDFTLEFKG